jgi:hypothetical protein
MIVGSLPVALVRRVAGAVSQSAGDQKKRGQFPNWTLRIHPRPEPIQSVI